MARRVRVLVGAFLLLIAIAETAMAGPRRVLLLESYGRDFEPFNFFVAKFRAELSRQSSEPVDFYEESLAVARFAEGEHEAPFVEYLRSLFADRRLDLVIAVGAPACGFIDRHRQRLFPTAPVLFTAVDERRLKDTVLTANDVVVSFKVDRSTILGNILKVRPQTAHILMVMGNSPNALFWQETLRRELRSYADQVSFTWLSALSFDQILSRVAKLPPQSAIYFGPFAVDSTAISQSSALAALHAVANAPIFSIFDSYLGQGIVGGPMISIDDLGREAAAVAVRIFENEAPREIRLPPLEVGTPVFDWRELQRWDIKQADLPAGSIVRFREPSTWERYRWYIVSAAAFCALQSIFLARLLANQRRLRRANVDRRRAEKEAHELMGRLISAQEQERSRLARELHDDVTQRLAILAINASREERGAADAASSTTMRTIREGLVQLSEDVHALSYRLHPSILEDLGLAEALRSECEHFSQTCSIKLDLNVGDIPKDLSQDAALCIFRIAQEGLRNIARHSRASRAEICLGCLDGGLRLLIKDDGAGFSLADHPTRMSLGHASMRQRVDFEGGKIDIQSRPGGGTIILVWVPLREQTYEPPARSVG